MPELPEVETIARQLGPAMRAQPIVSLEILDKKLGRLIFPAKPQLRVIRVLRVGKHIAIECGTRRSIEKVLAIHLRMTGRLLWVALPRIRHGKDLMPALRSYQDPFMERVLDVSKHVRAILWCRDGALVFSDSRRFGTLTLHEGNSFIASSGVDPITESFTLGVFCGLLRGVKQPIKNFLLRQDKISGIGNIYAAEALFRARIHPTRCASSLSETEKHLLFRTIRKVLDEAIKHCGTTFSDYQDSSGAKGSFQKFLRVYGRHQKPCRNCGTTICLLKQAGRSTCYCPKCQPQSQKPQKQLKK